MRFSKALCDLGASINLMSLSIYRKLGLRELKSPSITIQLVDRSLVHPKSVLEDVLVKVRQFLILAVFVILDFEDDHEILILFGRPFLATSKSTIDIEKNSLIMKIDGEVKVFKCDNLSKDEKPIGHLVENCNALSYHTTNDLDQMYACYLLYV